MSKSIKFKNNIYLDNSSIYKNAMTISVNDVTVTLNSWQNHKITGYTKMQSIGNKIIFSNGIEIGRNLSKVRVSASVKIYNYTENNTDFNLYVSLNDVAFYYTYETSEPSKWLNSVIQNVILNVSEGDTIAIGIIAGIPGDYRIFGGYLTVEEL